MPTDGNSPSEIDPHFDPPSVKEVKALRAALEEARKELGEVKEQRDGWEKAFYREERRAVEYHNADQIEGGFQCGHPVSCIRNAKGGGGAICIMCEQKKHRESLVARVVGRLERQVADLMSMQLTEAGESSLYAYREALKWLREEDEAARGQG